MWAQATGHYVCSALESLRAPLLQHTTVCPIVWQSHFHDQLIEDPFNSQGSSSTSLSNCQQTYKPGSMRSPALPSTYMGHSCLLTDPRVSRGAAGLFQKEAVVLIGVLNAL